MLTASGAGALGYAPCRGRGGVRCQEAGVWVRCEFEIRYHPYYDKGVAGAQTMRRRRGYGGAQGQGGAPDEEPEEDMGAHKATRRDICLFARSRDDVPVFA
jgi:hypothetical protein